MDRDYLRQQQHALASYLLAAVHTSTCRYGTNKLKMNEDINFGLAGGPAGAGLAGC